MWPTRSLVVIALLAFAAPARAQDPDDLGKLLDAVQQFAKPGPPATREESAQIWDGFLTNVSKRAASETDDRELRAGFFAALIEGRLDIVALLGAAAGAQADPLRELFASSWPRLAPLFEQFVASLPPDAARDYRALLEAGNALRDVGKIGGKLAGQLSALGLTPATLRQLAALVGAGDPLAYDTAVDPELRSVFGFGAPLAAPHASPLVSRRAFDPFAWLVPVAHAEDVAAAGSIESLAKRLNKWVPTRKDVAEYLPVMHALLVQTAQRTLATKPLEPEYHALYDDLVLATAWQESCWRQFVRNKKGVVTPIQSGVGSVGLMQINQKVWRGFYDLDGLNRDVAYNAAAGAEILRHYLRDYAIKKGEHTATGQLDDLARSTYSIYNGGPGHIRRYRTATTRADLKAIDAAFLAKYQAVQAGDEMGVVRCYTDAR